MSANEAKSKFVYPDKLYARTNDNITLDISYAPQTMEAVEYIRTDAFINKAADWLNNFYNEDTHSYLIDEDIEKFINHMKGE
jgi:hypothetical protein